MAATNKRGIFSLQDVKLRQGSGNWPTEAFTKPPYSLPWNYGYLAGGTPSPALSSTVQRIDMSNDNNVTSTRGPLTRVAYAGSGVISSDTHGYFVMGTFPYGGPYTTDIDRIEYANDTVTAIPRGNLSSAKLGSLTSNNSYGYNAGGFTGSAASSNVDRIDFSNDTSNATPKGPLSGIRYRHTGVGNQDYGYASAGNTYPPAARTQIDRIDYSNDTATALSRVAMGPYTDGQATGNADNGYFYKTSETLKYDYSNDTTALTSVGALATPSYRGVGVSNSQYGYIAGGDNTSPAFISTIQRQEFSNDTATLSIRGLLTRSGTVFKAASNQSNGRLGSGSFNLSVPNNQTGITTTGASVNFEKQNVFSYPYGWFSGGWNGSAVLSTTYRIDYSNDASNAVTRGPLTTARDASIGTANQNFGYVCGGGPSPFVSLVQRLDYSNDTQQSVTTGPLSVGLKGAVATATNNFGYIISGYTGSYYSGLNRIDFSNDTATASPRGFNNQAYIGAATGNANFGWVAGGSTPGVTDNVVRLDYSNDLATAPIRGALSGSRYSLGAVGNNNYGWFGGGRGAPGPTTKSTVDRVDFSNDTGTTPSRGPLSQTNQQMGGVSNLSYGWYGTGTGSGSQYDRIDFSNDTTTASIRGKLAAVAYRPGAHSSQSNALPQPIPQINDFGAPYPVQISAQQYAYFGGGFSTPNRYSTIDRLDFANDNRNTSPKGTLSIAREYLAATGNRNYGYFGSGSNPSQTSIIDRLDYSNDTSVAGPRGPLSIARTYNAAAGNSDYGWWVGGLAGGSFVPTIDRVDFSNDTATASSRGGLNGTGRGSIAGAGNQNYGWFAGGSSPGTTYSLVSRIDYSNDTPTTSARGNLATLSYALGSTGNSSYGWWGGGLNPGGRLSITQRIDYSNDTPQTTTRGNLSFPRSNVNATGNKNYGYWGQGNNPGITTFVDRLDFSNDTVTAPARGQLSAARYGVGASSASMNGLPQL
jgi:hypothetical protein